MANKLYEENAISSIAAAIRSKNGSSDSYKVAEMASAILNIPSGGGGITPTGTKEITENGTYDVTAFASALVNVSSGGGLPDNVVMGEFTPSSNEETHTITYAKDKAPIMAICFIKERPSATGYLHLASVGLLVGDAPVSAVIYTAGNGAMPTAWSASYSGINEMTATSTTFKTRASNYLMKAGFTYSYIIVF